MQTSLFTFCAQKQRGKHATFSLSYTVSLILQAFSAFYYIYYFLQQATDITITSPKLLEEAAVSVCNMTFQEVGPCCANPVPRYSELPIYISHIHVSPTRDGTQAEV